MARFKKGDIIREYTVRDGIIIGTICIGNSWVCNPSVRMMLDDGWELLPEPEPQPTPEPEPYVPTYAELVEQYIREHGYPTYGAELAALNNYAENPSEYLEAWQTYMGVRHEAKEWASEQPHREEEGL